MNFDRIPVLVVALCCVYAVGLSATTLQSSVATDPNDVVDVDASTLPFPEDAVGDLERRIARPAAAGEPEPTAAPQPPPDPADADAGSRPPDDGDSDGMAPPEDGPPDPEQSGSVPSSPGLLDRLLALLWTLLPVALLLAAAGLAVRHRTRLRTLVAALLARLGLGDGAAGADDAGQAPEPSLSNEVLRSWYEMVRSLDVDRARSKTPAEYAEEAVALGFDPALVGVLTRSFQEVRYGGRPACEDRVARTASALDGLFDERETDGEPGRESRDATGRRDEP